MSHTKLTFRSGSVELRLNNTRTDCRYRDTFIGILGMKLCHHLVDSGLAYTIGCMAKSSPFSRPVRVTNAAADDDSLLGDASAKKGRKETESVRDSQDVSPKGLEHIFVKLFAVVEDTERRGHQSACFYWTVNTEGVDVRWALTHCQCRQ